MTSPEMVALTIPRNINVLVTILDAQDNLDSEQLDTLGELHFRKRRKRIEFNIELLNEGNRLWRGQP